MMINKTGGFNLAKMVFGKQKSCTAEYEKSWLAKKSEYFITGSPSWLENQCKIRDILISQLKKEPLTIEERRELEKELKTVQNKISSCKFA